MKQFELAKALGITPGMVSRLAKRGMPTDSVERAQRWRKRHLEPGRVKGSRFDPAGAVPGVGSKSIQPRGQVGNPIVLSVVEVEQGAQVLNAAMVSSGFDLEKLSGFRELLRALPLSLDAPRLPLRVWLALIGHALEKGSELRQSDSLAACVTPAELGDLIAPGADAGRFWFCVACDAV